MKQKEIIELAHKKLAQIMKECTENGTEPTLTRMFCEGFKAGAGVEVENDGWHYIDVEGYPPVDEYGESGPCWCLIQCDGYESEERGSYDADKNEWKCEYWNASYRKVIAWHILPMSRYY